MSFKEKEKSKREKQNRISKGKQVRSAPSCVY